MINKKIAIIPGTSSYGGISTYCLNICIGLKQNDIDVYLIVPLEDRLNNLWIYDKAKESNIKTIEFELNSRNPISLGIKLYRILKQYDIRIIHTNHYRLNIIARFAKIISEFSFLPLRHLVTVHGINPLKLIPWQIVFYQVIDQCLSFMNFYTITVSQYTRKNFLKKSLVWPSRVLTIYNSIHFDNKSHKFSNNINMSENINIVFIGRLSIEKGIDFLIKIITKFIDNDKYLDRVIFNIYGDGDYSESITELSNKYPLNVKYHGFTSSSSLVLKNASIFIVPSIIETFGLVIVEAMANGVPSIATNVGGIPEVIDDNINGLLVDYGNVNDFIKALDKLILDKNLRDMIIQNAYSTLENKFSFEDFKNSYIKLLSKC